MNTNETTTTKGHRSGKSSKTTGRLKQMPQSGDGPKKRGRPTGSTKATKVRMTVYVMPDTAAWIKSQPHKGKALDRLVVERAWTIGTVPSKA